jgi:hypothetical protein
MFPGRGSKAEIVFALDWCQKREEAKFAAGLSCAKLQMPD